MARYATDEPRPRSDVYTGMVILTVVAMLLGCGLLAYEANEFGWESQPGPRTQLSLATPTITDADTAPEATPAE